MNPQGWAKVKQGARYADIIGAYLEKFAMTGKEVDSVVDEVLLSFEVFLTVELNRLGQM